MIIPRISSSLLTAVSQWFQRHAAIQSFKVSLDRNEHYRQQVNILHLQESHRILRNYNYQKDTEALNQYYIEEYRKEFRLLGSYTVRGIFIDRYC